MKFFDLHSDFPLALDNFSSANFLGATVTGAVYSSDLTFDRAIEIAKKVKKLDNKNVKLAFENIGYKHLNIDKIIELKPIYVSLTYNEENDFGYGCNFNLPLKTLGKSLVKQLSNQGIVIDVSHLSEKGAYSVLDITDRVICSHTALKSLFNHKRNLSDGLIKEIVSSGGIIGLTPVGYFLKEKGASLFDFFRHIDAFIQKFNINSLAIGTDFFGTDFIVGGIKDYLGFTKLKNIMYEKGYLSAEVDKVFYQNAYDYFNR